MSYLPFYLSLIIVFCWPIQSAAELYRWTDAQGVVHFTDQRPAETAGGHWSSGPLPEASTIQTRVAKPFVFANSASSSASSESAGDLSARRAAADQACAKVKADLARVQSRLRAGYREPRGNRLREQRRRLRKRYARECR